MSDMPDITERTSAKCPCCKRLRLDAHTVAGRRLDFFCASCGVSFDAEYVRDFERREIRILGHMKNPKYAAQFNRSDVWENLEIKPDPAIPKYLASYVLEVVPMETS